MLLAGGFLFRAHVCRPGALVSLIEKTLFCWHCEVCGYDWPVRNLDLRPKHCALCGSPDWWEGKGRMKWKKATIVKAIAGKLRKVQATGLPALREVRRVEAKLERLNGNDCE